MKPKAGVFALIGSAAGEARRPCSDLYRDGSWEGRSVSPALAGSVHCSAAVEQRTDTSRDVTGACFGLLQFVWLVSV
jgi:hypothetical protein